MNTLIVCLAIIWPVGPPPAGQAAVFQYGADPPQGVNEDGTGYSYPVAIGHEFEVPVYSYNVISQNGDPVKKFEFGLRYPADLVEPVYVTNAAQQKVYQFRKGDVLDAQYGVIEDRADNQPNHETDRILHQSIVFPSGVKDKKMFIHLKFRAKALGAFTFEPLGSIVNGDYYHWQIQYKHITTVQICPVAPPAADAPKGPLGFTNPPTPPRQP